MTITKLYGVVVSTLAITSALPQAGHAQDKQGAWQKSWEQFIDDYNSCTTTAGCDVAARFGQKEVTWKGTFAKVTCKDDGVSVRINLPPKTLVDKQGKPLENTIPPQPLKDINLNASAASCGTWNVLSAGTPVTFRGKTSRPIGYSNMRGNTFLVYYLDDARLVDPGGAK